MWVALTIATLLLLSPATRPAAERERHLVLLDFDRPEDAAFVRGGDLAEGHDGQGWAGGTGGAVQLRLTHLLPRGGWPLLALRARGAGTLIMTSDAGTTEQPIGAAWQWIVFPAADVIDLAGDFVIDDVRVLDNRLDLANLTGEGEPGGWAVRRAGLTTTATTDDGQTHTFDGLLPVDEANRLRLRLGGVTLYRHGRRLPGDEVTPVDITPISGVRLDRTAEGDSDGDGFDETRGSHRLIATGGRFAFRLTPTVGPATRPTFEIENVPEGEVRVTFDGATTAEVARLEEGGVLIVLPGAFVEPAEVRVRVVAAASPTTSASR
jgi:hypothetical protein